jgi:hypothetical protein
MGRAAHACTRARPSVVVVLPNGLINPPQRVNSTYPTAFRKGGDPRKVAEQLQPGVDARLRGHDGREEAIN